MLRSKLLLKDIRACRRIHNTASFFDQKLSSTNGTPSNQNVHFKDEGNLASIQEKALFGAVFNKIMKREELRKRNTDDILLQASSIQEEKTIGNKEDGRGLQVVFEKSNQEIRPEDRKLFEFFKKTSGTSQLGDIGESAKLTTDDIRNYPVSLISSIFADTESKKVPENDKATSKLLDETVAPLINKEIVVKTGLDLELNTDVLKKLESKVRFKAAMDNVMEPYLKGIYSEIETDYDFLIHTRKLLNLYTERDRTLDTSDLKSPAEIIAHIENQFNTNVKELPQPYGVTLPYVLVKLLSSKELEFPSERKYSLASYIYQKCKDSKDISLYLNICNVDFYNLLLQLSWDNFREIYQLKQLTSEMSINGIRGDIYTVEILDEIVHDLRHINDGILDEDTGAMDGTPLTAGVVWCRENSIDLLQLENYLKRLKESLT